MATTIALIPEGSRNRELYLTNHALPLNYMEDFSIMGFIVDRYPEACAILSSEGYSLHEDRNGIDLVINGPAQIREIDALLRDGNIQATFTDIADTIYQA